MIHLRRSTSNIVAQDTFKKKYSNIVARRSISNIVTQATFKKKYFEYCSTGYI